MSSGLIKRIRDNESNRYCADCGAANPSWASINIGCVVCIECSGIHRGLGTDVSKIRSIGLDKWTDEQVAFVLAHGNNVVNKDYEATLPPNFTRPTGSDTRAAEDFIWRKYAKKEFYRSAGVEKGDSVSVANINCEQNVKTKGKKSAFDFLL